MAAWRAATLRSYSWTRAACFAASRAARFSSGVFSGGGGPGGAAAPSPTLSFHLDQKPPPPESSAAPSSASSATRSSVFALTQPPWAPSSVSTFVRAMPVDDVASSRPQTSVCGGSCTTLGVSSSLPSRIKAPLPTTRRLSTPIGPKASGGCSPQSRAIFTLLPRSIWDDIDSDGDT